VASLNNGANVQFFLLRGQVRKVLLQTAEVRYLVTALRLNPDKLKFQIRTACLILVPVTDCRFRPQPDQGLLGGYSHALVNKDFGDDATFKMLNILNLAARNYLALCDGNLANLRQGTPNDCGDDETGRGQQCRDQ
jgi:hypothetical protein